MTGLTRAAVAEHSESRFDLLRAPLVGRFLRWRGGRPLLQALLLLVAAGVILHGFLGPRLAPKNLATLLVWVHYRGLLVLALVAAGNLFCMACPFMLPRNLARKVVRPRRNLPRFLRNKWLSVGLLVLILYGYELFDLWGAPLWTAALVLAYFAGALLVDSFFKGAPFCKYVCPIGQFNFAASTVSPLEVAVRDPEVCAACRTRDCIRGRREPESPFRVLQNGCELNLFLPRKTGNLDCTFCMDCVKACPHDNIGILSRVPGEELTVDPSRSGIGRITRRRDLGALAVVFVFGALVNAFGMVTPVYAFESWLARLLHLRSEAPVLGLIFLSGLVALPVLLLGTAAVLSRSGAARGERAGSIALRYAYGLLPLGFGLWVAHYSFHFLTGLWTFIPVTQYALGQAGLWSGTPNWALGGLPAARVYVLEVGSIALGLLGSLLVCCRLAQGDAPERPARAFAPWAAVCVLLFLLSLWLLSQPMEMRGTILGS